MKQMMLFL
uniref:Uncharacterized protein n=1 Tax=Anguilla anguilla TaxID=7936 RepID=A0A0E9UX48_ANGAN